MTGYPKAKHIQVVRDSNIRPNNTTKNISNKCSVPIRQSTLQSVLQSSLHFSRVLPEQILSYALIEGMFSSSSLSHLIQSAKNCDLAGQQHFRFQPATALIYNWVKIATFHWKLSFVDSLLALSCLKVLYWCAPSIPSTWRLEYCLPFFKMRVSSFEQSNVDRKCI